MTIKKKICDKCRKEIPENEPSIEFTGNLVFIKSGEDKTHIEKTLMVEGENEE